MAIVGNTSLPSFSTDLVLQNLPCNPSVNVGDWVRLDTGVIVQAIADSFDNANVLGLAESKSTSTLVNVRVGGISKPLFTGLDPSKEYLLSDTVAGSSNPTGVNVPIISGHVIIKVGQPVDSNRFLVLKGIRIIRS